MLADIAAAGFFEQGGDACDDRADRPAEKHAAGSARTRADVVAGDCAVQGRDHGDVLQRVYDVEKLGEGRAVIARPEPAGIDMIAFASRHVFEARSRRGTAFRRKRFGGKGCA